MMYESQVEEYIKEIQNDLSETDPSDALDKAYRYGLKCQIAALKTVLRVNR